MTVMIISFNRIRRILKKVLSDDIESLFSIFEYQSRYINWDDLYLEKGLSSAKKVKEYSVEREDKTINVMLDTYENIYLTRKQLISNYNLSEIDEDKLLKKLTQQKFNIYIGYLEDKEDIFYMVSYIEILEEIEDRRRKQGIQNSKS